MRTAPSDPNPGRASETHDTSPAAPTDRSRRDFFRIAAAATTGAVAFGALPDGWLRDVEAAVRQVQDIAPETLAKDERFWSHIQREWRQSAQFINLESGYYSPAAREVLDARCTAIRKINETPSFYMRRQQKQDRERARRLLAELAGCDPEEVALTRNTTESLNVVLQGVELQPDDEVVFALREYPSMREALEQRAERYGLRLKPIEIPRVPNDPAEVVDVYRRAIGPKTRMILVSHLVFLTGQVLPVREVAAMARERGIQVVVDGAHSFAHLDYAIPGLGGDYFGASLHKWLGAPLGLGILWMKREHIPNVWPLFGDTAAAKNDIRKFEHQGTQPVASIRTLADAIRFHRTIGGKRKEARLRYLKDSWTQRVVDLPRVKLHTPRDAAQSCAIANVSIDGITPAKLAEILYDRYGIFTVAVHMGVRVSPNLFTRPSDLDALVRAIRELAK